MMYIFCLYIFPRLQQKYFTKPHPLPALRNIKWLFLICYLWQWLALLDFLLFDELCFLGADLGEQFFGCPLFFTLWHELAFDGTLEDAVL